MGVNSKGRWKAARVHRPLVTGAPRWVTVWYGRILTHAVCVALMLLMLVDSQATGLIIAIRSAKFTSANIGLALLLLVAVARVFGGAPVFAAAAVRTTKRIGFTVSSTAVVSIH